MGTLSHGPYVIFQAGVRREAQGGNERDGPAGHCSRRKGLRNACMAISFARKRVHCVRSESISQSVKSEWTGDHLSGTSTCSLKLPPS